MEKSEKKLNLNIRIDDETEKKYYEIWDILQGKTAYPIRLKKQDAFAIMVHDYHGFLTGKTE
jgi:hypothetical protein